jgi:hypothetical protein
MALPDNLRQSALCLVPAELPGLARFWAVYERLDAGPVAHIRYLGALPGRDGETAEQLTTRALEQFGGAEGDG